MIAIKELALVLYGSQNYGLDGAESDKDYKIILCPEFNDFYNYHRVDKEDVPAGYDRSHCSPMSIMQFHSLLMNGNPNCLEMLFSIEWICHNQRLLKYLARARELFGSCWLAYTWDKFYTALTGLALNSIDRYGPNEKTVSRGYYMFSLANQIAEDGFSVCGDSFRNNSLSHDCARSIRFDGHDAIAIGLCEASVRSSFKENKERFSTLASEFRAEYPGVIDDLNEIRCELDDEIRSLVACELFGELSLCMSLKR